MSSLKIIVVYKEDCAYLIVYKYLNNPFYSLALSPSGSASDDLIYSQNELGSLGGRQKCLLLYSQALGHTEHMHVVDMTLKHVEAGRDFTVVDLTSQVLHELSAIIAGVIGDDGGELFQSVSV